MKEYDYIIGSMSGTSLDGLDLACIRFDHNEKGWTFSLHGARTIPYDNEVRKRIKAHSGRKKTGDTAELDLWLGEWMGARINEFIESLDLKVGLISSHGQTVYHNPEEGISLQLGRGQTIADICGIPVVSNFRMQDVRLGGQGAPLVPIGDLLLFGDYEYCLNLGGIANVSRKENDTIKAWDVCICNIGANHFANAIDLEFDNGGEAGRAGKLNPELLEKWNSLSYFMKKGPKSLDASFFSEIMIAACDKKMAAEDNLRTLYEHIARMVSMSIDRKDEKILVTGGGARNDFLIELMKGKFGLRIELPAMELVDFKEAVVFAFIGLLRWHGQNNVLASVTGAKSDHCSGEIAIPVLNL